MDYWTEQEKWKSILRPKSEWRKRFEALRTKKLSGDVGDFESQEKPSGDELFVSNDPTPNVPPDAANAQEVAQRIQDGKTI